MSVYFNIYYVLMYNAMQLFISVKKKTLKNRYTRIKKLLIRLKYVNL